MIINQISIHGCHFHALSLTLMGINQKKLPAASFMGWQAVCFFLLFSLCHQKSSEVTFAYGERCTFALSSCASLCQDLTEAVLVVARLLGVEGAVDEDGKGELVAVGGCDVACKGDDTRDGAGFGAHVAMGRTSEHALVECAIHSGNGECLIKRLIDGRSLVGIAQHGHLGIGGAVVV